jgi:hypothetical protein
VEHVAGMRATEKAGLGPGSTDNLRVRAEFGPGYNNGSQKLYRVFGAIVFSKR